MMGNEFRYLCLVETRRLLLVLGVVFGIVLSVQYFELPYSNFLSSLFATGKAQVAPMVPSTDSNDSGSRNLTNFSNFNSTDLTVVDGPSNKTEVSYGKDGNMTNEEDIRKRYDNSNENIDPLDKSPSMDVSEVNHNSTSESPMTNHSSGNQNIGAPVNESPLSNYSTEGDASLKDNGVGNIGQTSTENEDKVTNQETPPAESTPNSMSNITSPENLETSSGDHLNSPSNTSGESDSESTQQDNSTKISVPVSSPSINSVPASVERLKEPEPVVIPIPIMNDMLLQSRVSRSALRPQWPSPADQELLNVKRLIESTSIVKGSPQVDVNLYRNFSAFKWSYELMEQTLKIYIYAEGKQPIFHRPPLKGIYASEGWFMKLLKANKKFVTKNPNKAHLFYLPFSSRMLEETLYDANTHNREKLVECLSNYTETIMTKHNFWNRTQGADHFLVACHDWAPDITRQMMANCIRALCNADIKGGFRFGKDVSLPETSVRSPQNPLKQLGGRPPSQRQFLAFFAGSMHGYLRPILLKYWENKDPDMKITGKMRKSKSGMNYVQYMKSSKYCICAKGFEVNSPRVVEAIFYECVPVIISDNFVPPLFETLNWESFAVFIMEKDIPNLKNILLSISEERYITMQQRVKQVQQHFLWHFKPQKYDIFHMILHSVWQTRVFQAG